MIENRRIVWGSKCKHCKQDVFLLQEESHPWFAVDVVCEVKCENCGTMNSINQRDAERFYNNRIYELYKHVSGCVVDIGCGGGFITNHLAAKDDIEEIYAIDSDSSSKEGLTDSEKIHFILGDIVENDKLLDDISVDYMVSRDVVMYFEDLPLFIQRASKIVKKGIVIVGWYNPTLSRVKNKVHPEKIKEMLAEQGLEVEYEEFDWYKFGYVINARVCVL